jgi:hypothetical protein
MEPAPQSNTAPFYRSYIVIDGVDLRDILTKSVIAPDMPLLADIRVNRHTVLDYLLGGMLGAAAEGIRESSRVRRIRGWFAA